MIVFAGKSFCLSLLHMQQERKIEDNFCDLGCLKSTMMKSFMEFFGFTPEENNPPKQKQNTKPCTEQPTLWNKLGKDIKIKYPIITTQDWNTKYAARIRHLELLLKTEIHKYDKPTECMKKASVVHSFMKSNGIVNNYIQKYEQWGAFSFGFNRPNPVFIYIGNFHDDTTYAVVLDGHGNNVAIYYGKSTSPQEVEVLWQQVLNGYDWRGAIQSVVLMDNFYHNAIKNDCPYLIEGQDLKKVWDNDLDQMCSAEICYEVLGFGENIFDEGNGRRYSHPGFCCIDIFNGNQRPHIYNYYKEGLVWHIENSALTLVRPRTGEIWEKHLINDKPNEFIAEKIVEHCD